MDAGRERGSQASSILELERYSFSGTSFSFIQEGKRL
jgi:hypothetical protein